MDYEINGTRVTTKQMKLVWPPARNGYHTMSDPATELEIGTLHDSILLKVLEKLAHPLDRQSWSLTCKHFFDLEAGSRRRLSLLRTHNLPLLARRYAHLQHLNLSPCTCVTDESLHCVGLALGSRLLSLNLTKVRTFSELGLTLLAKQCSKLLELDLSQCVQVQDLGIMAISQIQGLQSLKLKGCKDVTDCSLTFLTSKCRKLLVLCLKWCIGITDESPAAIGTNCLELRELDLSYTEITNVGLSALSKLSCLEKLSLVACNGLDDDGLANLKFGNKALKELDVSRSRNFSYGGLMNLAYGPCFLTHLSLSYCFVGKDAMYWSFFDFNGLCSIRLDGCDVSFIDFTSIGMQCTSLKELSLSKCKGLTDAALSAVITGCSSLQNINLTCCREVTDAGLSSIAASCMGLISLKMESCSNVTQHGLHKLCRTCKSLQDLDLTDTSVSDAGLISIAKCKSLKTLKLGFCENIHDSGLAHIAAGCPNLTELDVYRSVEIGDAGIAAVCHGCTNLTALNLSYCNKVTNTALFAVACLRDLRVLEIRNCIQVTCLGLLAVAKSCRRLVELDMKRCTSLEDFTPLMLAQCCRNLRQINMSNCLATDGGMAALAKLNRMQNMRLIHVGNVSVRGFSELLLVGESLKKVKLLVYLRDILPPMVIEQAERRGCRLKWMEKL